MKTFRCSPHAAVALVVVGLLLTGCARQVRLAEADRAALVKQPAIHVLHYETALPSIKTYGGKPPATATDIRRAAGADPATLIAQSFARTLERKEKLRNLRTENKHLPRPVATSASAHRERYRRGLALEVWVDDWTIEQIAGEPGNHAMRLEARARLAQIEDGRVQWTSGACRVNGTSNRELRLTTAELTNSSRVRKALAVARNDCTRQFTREFYPSEDRK